MEKLLAFLNPYLAYWKIALAAILVGLAFVAGYHLHTLKDASDKLAIEKQAIADYKKSTDFNNAVSAAYETGRQKGAKDTKAAHSTLAIARKTNPQPDCPLSADDLKAVNQ